MGYVHVNAYAKWIEQDGRLEELWTAYRSDSPMDWQTDTNLERAVSMVLGDADLTIDHPSVQTRTTQPKSRLQKSLDKYERQYVVKRKRGRRIETYNYEKELWNEFSSPAMDQKRAHEILADTQHPQGVWVEVKYEPKY